MTIRIWPKRNLRKRSGGERYFDEEYYVTYFVGCFCLGTLIILQYSNWFKDIAYVIRRWKIKSNLTALQKNREHNCFSNTTPIEYLSPTEIGFAPSDEQILIENPYITDFDSNSQDDCVPAPNSGYNSFVESLSFKAGSDTGSWLVVKYERDAKAKLGLPWLLWHHPGPMEYKLKSRSSRSTCFERNKRCS